MVPVLAAMSAFAWIDPYVLISVYARRELRVHDAGGHAAERDRIRNRAGATAKMTRAVIWLNLAGILLITALITLFITPLLGNEGWQSSKATKDTPGGAHQGQASMKRMGGTDER